MISGNPQSKISDLVKEIIRQRMSFETTASLNNRPVIKTKITIPRNSVVINNTEILCDKPRIHSVKNYEKKKNKSFGFSGRKNGFLEG